MMITMDRSPKSMQVAASSASAYLQSERANFRESARIRFLAGARRRLIGGEVRGIPSHSHVDDHRRRGGRLLSYDFFEDDSRSMFHELAPERVKATTKRNAPPCLPGISPFAYWGKLKISRNSCDRLYVHPSHCEKRRSP